MPFTFSETQRVIRKSMGLPQGTEVGTEQEIVSSVLSWLENARSWRYLETGQTTLDLVEDQPYVYLPDDVKRITGYSATRALINTLRPTTLHEIIRLRSQRTVTSQLHFWAALENILPGSINLLVKTEDLSDTDAWGTISIGATPQTRTVNHYQSPLSGENTATRLHTSGAGVLRFVAQDVKHHLLTDGWEYVSSVWLRKDPTIAHTSDLSRVIFSVPGGTSQVTGDVDWSGAAPVFSLVSSAGTLPLVGSELGPDGYIRVWCSFQYDKQEGSSDLRTAIYPCNNSADTGAIHAFGPQVEPTLKSKFGLITDASSTKPTAYDAVRTANRSIQGKPRPALALWPAPTADQVGTLSIAYVREARRPTEDVDVIDIPQFLDHVFITALQIVARGFEEHEINPMHERLESLKRSEMFEDAEYADSEIMPNIGPMVAGHVVQSSSGWINWDTGATSALP
jgi:hypothetical protein